MWRFPVGYVGVCLAIWLLGGFIVMNWDVRTWEAAGRYFAVWLSLMGGVVVVILWKASDER